MKTKISYVLAGLALLSTPLWAQPADPRPSEPSFQKVQPRQVSPSITPDREAVWLFEEGKRLHRLGETQRALDQYRRALVKDNGRIEYRPYLALALLQTGRYKESLEQYDLYLRQEPKDLSVRTQRLWPLISLGLFDTAEQEINQLKLSNSGNLMLHELAAYYNLKRNRYQQAADEYRIAIAQAGPHRPDLVINLARCLSLLGKDAEALKLLEGIGPLPANSTAIVANNMGVLKTNGGQASEAQKLFEESWKGSQQDALYNLANQLADQGKTRESILAVAKLLDLTPDHLDGQMLYVRLLSRQNRLDEARKAVDRLQSMGQTALGWRWPYICELSGLVSLQQDDNESARQDLEQAVLALPKSPSAHHNLALALSRQGSLDDAANEELTAIKLSPENPSMWYHLGVIYDLQARPTKALDAYTKFLELRPNDPENPGLLEHIKEIRESLRAK